MIMLGSVSNSSRNSSSFRAKVNHYTKCGHRNGLFNRKAHIVMSRILSSWAICLIITQLLVGKDIYVSPNGSDTDDGSKSKPLRSIQATASQVSAGDTIILRGGFYADPVTLSELRGSENMPIVIRSYPGEEAIFDGTDLLDGQWKLVTPDAPEGKLIQEAQWKRIGNNELYIMQLKQDIYALIYEGKLMSDARWPNANWDAPYRLDRYAVLRRANEQSRLGELYDDFPTENTLEESSQWIHYDRQALDLNKEMLAETGLDFTGSIVVLSYAWTSFATRITRHQAGHNNFTFDTTFKDSHGLQEEAIRYIVKRIEWDNPKRFMRSQHGGIHFFIMGLPALDHPGEWAYHRPTRSLYFIPPDGQPPISGAARGKRRDYLVILQDFSHVHFRGMRFNGSAILMKDCDHSRIEDCCFFASSYNKFAIGDFDMPVTSRIENKHAQGDAGYHNALVNCQFSWLDGNAFEGRSAGLVIDNVLIFQTQQTTLGNDSRSASFDTPSVVRRVTISDVGASVGIKGGGRDGVYELNNIARFGGLQYDGAALQMGGRHRVIYRYNWSHDHPKRSYRFDAASYPSFTNAFGEMSYNVAWNTPGGFAIKGDDHLIHNNVLVGEGKMELFNMVRWASENKRTFVANNVVPMFSAGINDRIETKAREPAEILSIMKNNFTGDPGVHLRNPENLDFRPKEGSSFVDTGYRIQKSDVPWKKTPFTGAESVIGKGPDIGAYEYGTEVYWIPGFQFAHASTPVPPDGTTTAKNDCDLMWLGGYKAGTHDLYFGTSAEEVEAATKEDPAFRKTFRGSANIFDPGMLERGKTYFWRIDTMHDGESIKGKIWKFTVEQQGF